MAIPWGTIISAVGTGVDLLSQHKASEAEDKATEFNIQGQLAKKKSIEYKRDIDLERLMQYKDSLISQQRLAFAKSGVVIDRNTAMEVVKDTARKYDKDREIIIREAELDTEKVLAGVQEERSMSDSRRTATLLNMTGTALDFAAKTWG